MMHDSVGKVDAISTTDHIAGVVSSRSYHGAHTRRALPRRKWRPPPPKQLQLPDSHKPSVSRLSPATDPAVTGGRGDFAIHPLGEPAPFFI